LRNLLGVLGFVKALRHTLDAGNAATSAVKLAAHKVADAYKKVI
jgi:hypothetical protein